MTVSDPVRILVLYYSAHGNVAAMARQVARGVEEVANAVTVLRTVPRVTATVDSPEPAIPADGPPYAEPGSGPGNTGTSVIPLDLR